MTEINTVMWIAGAFLVLMAFLSFISTVFNIYLINTTKTKSCKRFMIVLMKFISRNNIFFMFVQVILISYGQWLGVS